MAGEETDRLFRMKDTKARVAYLNGSKAIEAPPIELIQFVDNKVKKSEGESIYNIYLRSMFLYG